MEGLSEVRERASASSLQRERTESFQMAAAGCSFCGAPVRPGQTVCDECGMPLAGVRCPVCGTLNHRSFCSRCNAPLNRAAEVALEKAKKDPVFQQVRDLVEKAVALREKMTGKQAEPGEGTLEFLKMFSAKIDFTQSAQTSDRELQQEYRSTVRDIEKLFSEMLPPAGSTPQQQFNYYSARNVAVTTVVQEEVRVNSPLEWVCNYCGCHHSQPSDCSKPFLGGTWIYQDRVVQKRVIRKEIRAEE